MKSVETTMVIRREPRAVWDVLSDFDAYEEWNPILTVRRGTPRAGSAVEVAVDRPGHTTRTETAKLTAVDPGVRLQWEAVALYSWLYRSTQTFELRRLEGGRTRLVNRTACGGILAPLVVSEGFETENERLNRALADRVENR